MQEQQETVENQSEFDSPYKKRKPSLIGRYFFFLLIFLLAFGGIYQLGFDKGKSVGETFNANIPLKNAVVLEKRSKKDEVDFTLFWKAWDLVREKYVDSKDLNAQKMLYGAIQGMLSATNDPYTAFLTPDENKEFNEEIRGSFEGIGAEIGLKKGILTIIAPLKDSPAEKAGLRSGDSILKINDEETVNMGIDFAVQKMRGSKGTEVKLTIFRTGEDATREVKITRGLIDVKSVTYEFYDGSVAFIRVTRFGDDTTKEFEKAILLARDRKVKGLIIDLRNNPGGYLDAAVDMASLMLPKGSVVVMEEDHEKKRTMEYVRKGDVLSSIPTVVLINKGSASASEILAGALKDNRENVVLVGEKSYGKGSVQELIPLSQKSAIKITVAKWLTPKGNQINEKGIEPDVKVELSDDDYDNNRDPQLDKAKEVIREKMK